MFVESHPLKAQFRSNYAAKVDLELDLPAGSSRLRLQCPGTGGIFVGGRALYRTEAANADEVWSTRKHAKVDVANKTI